MPHRNEIEDARDATSSRVCLLRMSRSRRSGTTLRGPERARPRTLRGRPPRDGTCAPTTPSRARRRRRRGGAHASWHTAGARSTFVDRIVCCRDGVERIHGVAIWRPERHLAACQVGDPQREMVDHVVVHNPIFRSFLAGLMTVSAPARPTRRSPLRAGSRCIAPTSAGPERT